MNNDYVGMYHSGILGMHWGIRRYQNPDGSLTDAGRKRYYKGNGELTRAGKKASRTNPNIRSEKESKSDKRTPEERKKDAIEKGDVRYASNHIHDFSNEEINTLINRYDLETRLSDKVLNISKREADIGKAKMEKITNFMSFASKSLSSVSEIAKSLNDTMDTIGKMGNKGDTESKFTRKEIDDILAHPDKYSSKTISNAQQRALDMMHLAQYTKLGSEYNDQYASYKKSKSNKNKTNKNKSKKNKSKK